MLYSKQPDVSAHPAGERGSRRPSSDLQGLSGPGPGPELGFAIGTRVLRRVVGRGTRILPRGLGSCVLSLLLLGPAAFGQGDDRFIGVWAADEGFQIVELLFRSDGRYQRDTRSTDPVFDFSSTERGRYEVQGQTLTLAPYDYSGDPERRRYEWELAGDALTLVQPEYSQTQTYQFKAGSRADVLERQQVARDLVGTWERYIQFFGTAAYTFRPGGYYFLKNTHEDSQFPPEFIRGRYQQDGARLTLTPYSGTPVEYELDFFGNALTLIKHDQFSGDSVTYEDVPGSKTEVRAKAAEAAAFLGREHWQVGVWEVRAAFHTVDLTFRPDGHYIANNETEFLRGVVRGRYTLEPGRIRLFPFVGQGLYSRDNGEFGKVERTRELDYYDGELQFIDLEGLSQSVTIARKRPGTEAAVLETTRLAHAERERAGWYLGIWEVNDPAGWMQFTFRPDRRYIAQSGAAGVPSQVERGRYRVAGNKLTLAPYPGLGEPRGFELDLYDGDWFIVGDLARMVVARKVPGSETVVIAKTEHPDAMKGERGSILGLWTADVPGQSTHLVFRPDGQFRLDRCANKALSQDYGLYSVDLPSRTLIYDSRFTPVRTQGLDFYGNTLTIFGGSGPPSTYTVNLGVVDAAIAASHAADAAEAQIDAQWLERVPIGLRDPNAVQIPAGDIPADPHPDRIFPQPTVFSGYHLYRRLSPSYVYFNVQGAIWSVAVVNTREWHFFPTGRVLVRFRNYRAGAVYPVTVADITDFWGAYRLEPKPELSDILHLYADNTVFLETDLGEALEMTLEDGRRHLFWGKDYMILSEWAAEQKPVLCELPGAPDASLINTGVTLATNIEPDEVGDTPALRLRLTGPSSGTFTLSGTTEAATRLVTEGTPSLVAPVVWRPLQTNNVPGGPFSFAVPQGPDAAAYFRVREVAGFTADHSSISR